MVFDMDCARKRNVKCVRVYGSRIGLRQESGMGCSSDTLDIWIVRKKIVKCVRAFGSRVGLRQESGIGCIGGVCASCVGLSMDCWYWARSSRSRVSACLVAFGPHAWI